MGQGGARPLIVAVSVLMSCCSLFTSPRPPSPQAISIIGHDCIGHNYIGHNPIGHSHIAPQTPRSNANLLEKRRSHDCFLVTRRSVALQVEDSLALSSVGLSSVGLRSVGLRSVALQVEDSLAAASRNRQKAPR